MKKGMSSDERAEIARILNEIRADLAELTAIFERLQARRAEP
jgi:hypothetical protein